MTIVCQNWMTFYTPPLYHFSLTVYNTTHSKIIAHSVSFSLSGLSISFSIILLDNTSILMYNGIEQ